MRVCMGEWMNVSMNGLMDEFLYELVNACMNG